MTAVLTHAALCPDDVRDVLARSILADGLDFVLDIERSAGSYLIDARTGERYLDMFTFFASSALGMNHPALAADAAFARELTAAAVQPSFPNAAPGPSKSRATRTSTACRWRASSTPSSACSAILRCPICSSS